MDKVTHIIGRLDLARTPLIPTGKISNLFITAGISELSQAIHYVHQLPYGRTNTSDYLLVLREQRGTCSTKHALIAALANELGVPMPLHLGIFIMDAINTPKVATVLQKYRLPGIPEAHCYLQYAGKKFDITFPNHAPYPVLHDFIKEIVITPNNIGEHKIYFHKQFIKDWLSHQQLNYSLADLWSIRELCINALSHP